MKVFTISAALLSLGAYVQAYTPGVYVTFEGAADASYSQVVPADGTTFTLENPLSISHIRTYNYASCTFKGVDGSNTVLNGPGSVDVGPPQTQISGRCTRPWQR